MSKQICSLSVVVAIGTIAFAQQDADGDATVLGTWNPYCGSDVSLVAGESVEIDSVLSGGILEVSAALPKSDGLEPLVAYAVDYGEGHWYQAGDATYFTLPSDLVTQDKGITQARIPLRTPGFADLNPSSEGVAQQVHVWFGYAGVMEVDPVDGVSGDQVSGAFGIVSDLPDYTLIPEGTAASTGVVASRQIDIVGFRKELNGLDEVFELTYSGPAGLLEALDLPDTIMIPEGEVFGWSSIVFVVDNSTHWPGGESTLTVTATGSETTLTTEILFSGEQSSTHSIVETGGSSETGQEYCKRNTIPVPAKEQKNCGECSNAGAAIACDVGKVRYWTIPYACAPGTQICEVFDKQITVEYATIALVQEGCWYWYVPKPNELGTYWPIYLVRGKRNCCVDTPSGMTFSPTVKDCRTK